VSAESQNSGKEEVAVIRQQGGNIFTATDDDAKMDDSFEAVFSLGSLPSHPELNT
jgi:hypothetical protein